MIRRDHWMMMTTRRAAIMTTTRTAKKRERQENLQNWSTICLVTGVPSNIANYLVEIDPRTQEIETLQCMIGARLGMVQPRLNMRDLVKYCSNICNHLKSPQAQSSIQQFWKVNEKPAILFSLGITPFKIQVNLPNRERITVNIVNKACHEQGVTSLPVCLPFGVFELVRETDNTRIYRYTFDCRKGCRTTTSDFHGSFPVPIDDQVEATELLKYRTADLHGLGNLLSEGDCETLESVDVCNGSIRSTYIYNGKINSTRLTEEQVSRRVVDYVNNQCTTCVATYTPNTDSRISEFKGEGGILLQSANDEAIITVGGMSSGDEDTDDESSPVYCDEIRTESNIELKYLPKEDQKCIELQLRANMILCLASKLGNMLDHSSLAELRLLNTMSINGVTFGYRSLHLLLKLTVSFTSNTTTTKVRFRSDESVQWAVEASVGYIISKMKAKHVASATPTPSTQPPPTPPPPRP